MKKRIGVKREEEKFKKVTLAREGNPKTLLQEFFGFLSAQARDQQRYDEAKHGLISFKRTQEDKNIPMELHEGGIVLRHCPKKGTNFSQAPPPSFKEKLQSRLNYIRENVQRGRWDYVGKALSQEVFGGGFDCSQCRTRFRLRIFFDREKVPKLLEKLQKEGVIEIAR